VQKQKTLCSPYIILLFSICMYTCNSDDAMDVQPVDTVKLQSISENLQTGDIVLMKGITVSGSIIRLFDQSEFSHIGMVSCLS
jgi:hypothetical protein